MRNDRRIGRFKVLRQFIMANDCGETVFAGFVPLRVELLAYEDAFDCVGLHADFDTISLGEMAPEYECIIERGADATDITGLPVGEATVTRTFRRI